MPPRRPEGANYSNRFKGPGQKFGVYEEEKLSKFTLT